MEVRAVESSNERVSVLHPSLCIETKHSCVQDLVSC